MEYTRAVKILKVKIGLISNKEELIEFKEGPYLPSCVSWAGLGVSPGCLL